MADLLWKGAQHDLIIQAEGMPPDACVWEHSVRVARIADALRAIPELAGHALDPQALQLAALYHDAGWVAQVRGGECHARDILLKPTTDLQRELGVDLMTQRAAGVVGPGVITHAARIIRYMNVRRTDMLEARVLADAENLDEIGPHSICLMTRKMCAEGRTIEDVLSLFERQREYNYWPARIRDGFHFETVRRAAQARFEKLARFMDELSAAVRLEDLTFLGDSKAARAVE